MRPNFTKDCLLRALDGDLLSAANLDQLINAPEGEGQWVDFKSGKHLKQSKPGRMVREYVSAFANSDGGLLVVGVEEDKNGVVPRSIDGAEGPGGQKLDEWASNALTGLAAWLAPSSRLQVVAHPDGNVLIVATSRSARLAPCEHAGGTRFFLRIGHQTLEAPEYLATDLVLGRRNKPVLELQEPERIIIKHPANSRSPSHLAVTFSLHNNGLVLAEEPTIGIVAWTQGTPQKTSIAGHAIRQHIETNYPGEGLVLVCATGRGCISGGEEKRLHPFEQLQFASPAHFSTRSIPHQTVIVTWAVFVVARGHEPDWYEFEISLWGGHNTAGDRKAIEACPRSLQRCVGRRPVVSWVR